MFDWVIKDLAGQPAFQTVIVSMIGQAMKMLAQKINVSAAPDERGKAIIQLVIVGLSLVMGFLEQMVNGTLNAFDPAPWTHFFTVLMSSWGLIMAAEKGSEKVKAVVAKLIGD